jgi:dephospho-CoA kinase
MERMTTLGLVGGVASGKSLVSKYLAELGAGVLDADRAGHEVLATDPEVRQALVDRWGRTILAEDGQIDRKAIAARIFAGPDAADSVTNASAEDRRFVESLLHPRISQRLQEQRRQFVREGRPAVVLDAPLLLEAGWQPLCDLVVMVDSTPEARLARAKSRGWDEAEFNRREAAQLPLEEKRRHADVVLANDQSPRELRYEVGQLWARILSAGSEAN